MNDVDAPIFPMRLSDYIEVLKDIHTNWGDLSVVASCKLNMAEMISIVKEKE